MNKFLPILLCLFFASTAIAQTGNVGIGTNTPAYKLDVFGNTIIGDGTGGNNVLYFRRPQDGVGNAGITTTTVGGFSIYNHSGGRDLLLSVNGNGNIIFGDNAASQNSIATEVMRVDVELGRVGIGTDTPAGTLHVEGTAYKPGGGSWVATSDRRTKKDIKEYSDGLEALMKINTVTYKYNGVANINTGEEEFVGIIAQDVQKFAPYMIKPYMAKMNKDDETETEILAVDPSAFTYMLINAVQEQNKVIDTKSDEIETLKAEIQALKKDNSELTTDVQSIKKENAELSADVQLIKNEILKLTTGNSTVDK